MRESIRREAQEQRRLRAAGQPIPPELRRMARRAGLGIFLLCGGSAVLIAVAAVWTGSLYGVAALFLLVMAGLGLLQVFTGRHIITGRGR